jgi:hypothetical protein
MKITTQDDAIQSALNSMGLTESAAPPADLKEKIERAVGGRVIVRDNGDGDLKVQRVLNG